MKNTMFIGVAVVLSLVIAFCIGGTVHSMEKRAGRAEKAYERELEKDYVLEVRAFLNEKGFKNSGVTMNGITEENGEKSYTITIHHDRIEKMSEQEKEKLEMECRAIKFEKEDCSFTYSFLE